MRSTFSGLNALTRGIYVNQTGLDTVGHNISNANTEGYSRQVASIVSTRPETVYGEYGPMQMGTGAAVESVVRARDTFLDRQFWQENSSLGYGETATEILGKIEGVFREPSEYGLQTVLNNFWQAWQTLSTNASDDGARAALQQRGVELRDAIGHAAQQLKDMVADINSVVEIKVNKVNQITSEILSLNKQIALVETGGRDHANDLRDRRDVLVDQLSTLVGVTVTEDKYGNYIVRTGNVMLVDGNVRNQLGVVSQIDADYGYEVLNVVYGGTVAPGSRFMTGGLPVELPEGNKGEIKGLLAMRDLTGVKGYLDKLATMSQFFLTDFNNLHQAGYGLADSDTGNEFFVTGGASPATKAEYLSAFTGSTIVDTAKIAARSAATLGVASGDHAVALSNLLKTVVSPTLGNATLDSFYNSFIGKLGVQSQDAKRLAENQKTLVSQIRNWRESVAGVNMDEEMTNMIRYQKGYNAAARVITTIDEMLDKLINSTGVVGR
ncbi:flagellar hook-associated protein FlgK [Sporolituus thermophilus]|uniref:Flagellar hook-associated protein 1 n=1 Tax=Sporolituus thermophilus DSM 23256 TaxID=1123285 RepID=A0A1G7NZP9_9FIRM|nr:flagellar hook-associated protein FlgK [Sporolituus thermophilus]SDF79548.1 flagellar hook-associated protein 1 FlgK [Sporolituus thermophilus DSM 23256]